MSGQKHWEDVYNTKATDRVSWYQSTADTCLRRIMRTQVDLDEAVVDIGGGASVLVDALLEHGFTDVTVLDLSSAALRLSQARLGERASTVRWLHQSVLDADFPVGEVSVWHDRAVFHFMTTPEQRQAYYDAMASAVRPGAHAIVATFAEDGPTKCSGLAVARYTAEELAAAFSPAFALVSSERELHTTPGGSTQSFTVCHLQRASSSPNAK